MIRRAVKNSASVDFVMFCMPNEYTAYESQWAANSTRTWSFCISFPNFLGMEIYVAAVVHIFIVLESSPWKEFNSHAGWPFDGGQDYCCSEDAFKVIFKKSRVICS